MQYKNRTEESIKANLADFLGDYAAYNIETVNNDGFKSVVLTLSVSFLFSFVVEKMVEKVGDFTILSVDNTKIGGFKKNVIALDFLFEVPE